jgi:hypothetical protein
MGSDFRYDVFLSYSSKVESRVRRIAERFKAAEQSGVDRLVLRRRAGRSRYNRVGTK